MRRMIRLLLLTICFLAGCQPRILLERFARQQGGDLLVYVQPFPAEAYRLTFELEAVSAQRDDGTEVPLGLSLPRFEPPAVRRQRLMASGRLPPGSYRALLVRVKRAVLRTDEGEAALILPEEAVRLDASFTVDRDTAQALFLRFRYADSIRGGIGFRPSFELYDPGRPLPTLVGYVSNSGSRYLTVFDKRAGQVTGVVPTGDGPEGIALDPSARRAYVALSRQDAVDVVDVAAGATVNRIRLNAGDSPLEAWLAPDRRTLLVLNGGSDTVSFVDVASSLEVRRVNVGHGPTALVPDPNGRRVYVPNSLAGTLSVLDVATSSLVATVATEPWPVRAAFNRRGDALYVVHERSPYLIALNPVTLTVTRRVLVGAGASFLKTDPDTDLAYLATRDNPEVSALDPFTLTPAYGVGVGPGASCLAIDGDEKTLYAVIPEKREVVGFNVNSRKIVSELDVGEAPYWVTVMGER